MTERRLQKVFYFSNKKEKSIIEGLLADEAEITKRSISYLIEQHILGDFLPEEKTVSRWIKMLYAKDDKGKPISNLQDTMIAIFSYMAAGLNNKSKSGYGKPLVNFAFENCCLYKQQFKNYEKAELPYYRNQLAYMIERMEMAQKDNIGDRIEMPDKKIKRDFAVRELKRIKDEKEITNDTFCFLYTTMMDNWDILYDWTYTYRLLTAMARIQCWEESAVVRMQLIKVLNDLAHDIKS